MRNIFIVPLKVSITERQQQNAVFKSIIPIMGKVQINVRVWCMIFFKGCKAADEHEAAWLSTQLLN